MTAPIFIGRSRIGNVALNVISQLKCRKQSLKRLTIDLFACKNIKIIVSTIHQYPYIILAQRYIFCTDQLSNIFAPRKGIEYMTCKSHH